MPRRKQTWKHSVQSDVQSTIIKMVSKYVVAVSYAESVPRIFNKVGDDHFRKSPYEIWK